MQDGHLLVQVLRKQIHIVLVGLGLLPILHEIQLCENLIGERATHDKGRVPSGTTQVQEAARCEDDHAVPLHLAAMRVYLVLSRGMESRNNCKMHLNSALSVLAGSGKDPSL